VPAYVLVKTTSLATVAAPKSIDGSFRCQSTLPVAAFTAVDAATGKVLWQHKLTSMDFGAATVANDVVFTSTYAGTIYAFDTESGKTLWSTKAPAGINSFPAIDGDTLLIGAAAPGFLKKPQFELIAYSLQ
jgi:outer membrane protein assembly factor BamB